MERESASKSDLPPMSEYTERRLHEMLSDETSTNELPCVYADSWWERLLVWLAYRNGYMLVSGQGLAVAVSRLLTLELHFELLGFASKSGLSRQARWELCARTLSSSVKAIVKSTLTTRDALDELVEQNARDNNDDDNGGN